MKGRQDIAVGEAPCYDNTKNTSPARNRACGGGRLLKCVKNAKLCSVRAKAQVGVCLAPQPKGWG